MRTFTHPRDAFKWFPRPIWVVAATDRVPTLEEAAADILGSMPAADDSEQSPRFHRVSSSDAPPRVAAVDGGSTVALDARTVGLYVVRAGYALREATDVYWDRLTTRTPRTVTRRAHRAAWDAIRDAHAWGVDVEPPPFDPVRMVPQLAEAERVLAEFDAARRALHELKRGDLLVLDGSLDEEDRRAPLRDCLLDRARDAGVAVAALSKDSSLTLRGVLPFPVELEERAFRLRISTPWWADVTEALDRRDQPYRILAVRFDSRAPPYRLDVAGAPPDQVVAGLLSLCNDAAYPGYPYALARIHERVSFDSPEAVDLRRELEGIVARRLGQRLALRLFGRGRDVLALAR